MRQNLLRIITLSTALMFVVCATPPLTALAATNNTSADTQTGCGLTHPTGADANTYTYDAQTGLYVNQYYTWSPITCQTTPITPLTYTYNYTTKLWDANEWEYDAASSQFVLTPVSVSQPPAGAITVMPPPPQPPTTSNGSPDSGSTSNNNGTSTSSNNSQSSVNNQLNSNSQTGNSSVDGNTTGGNATTGNALTQATIMNLLQSSSSLLGGNATSFTDNITGNVNGDLVVDPSSIVQPVSSSQNLTVNTNTNNNNQINNNIDLGANSGNASVDQNTSAGNATSGNADAVANVVNMIDSMIAANQSFVGVINILGDLNGNILMPSQFLNGLIASNAPSTTVNLSDVNNAALTSNLNNNQSINNNVTTTAQTGQAGVTNNTSAGNATSGSANTKVTIFNLTGDQIVTSNTLLVFVNVLGQWVGMLMNAPAGSTAAAFGSGITQDNTLNSNSTTNNQGSINNNIDVKANSGSATVADNTKAGNATSGNADAAANLLNVDNSSITASNWFGILFINVFGSWDGNFGVENPIVAVPFQGNSSGTTFGNIIQRLKTSTLKNLGANNSNAILSAFHKSTNNQQVNNPVLVSAHISNPKTLATGTATKADLTSSKNTAGHERKDDLIAGIVLVSVGLVLFGGEQIIRRKYSKTV